MRLTLIISSLQAGGAERIPTYIANHWASQEHDVSLVTFDKSQTKPFYTLHQKIHLIQLDQHHSSDHLLHRFKNIFGRLYRLRKILKTLKPDIIVSFMTTMNISTLLATVRLNIPIVISERIDPHHHHVSKLTENLRLMTYPWCTKLIVQTKGAACYFPIKMSSQLKIIPNFIPCPQVTKNTYSSKVTNIISAGRLDLQKDHATLLKAFANLVPQYPYLMLKIYGEGPERPILERLIRSLELQNHVLLPGVTSAITDALIQADLFVFPSRYEGFPNALCEAMALGLPVIASDCSGSIDIVRNSMDGRLFSIGDVDALVKIMRDFIQHPHQCMELGRHARDVCQRFNPERLLKEWDDVIDEAVPNRF